MRHRVLDLSERKNDNDGKSGGMPLRIVAVLVLSILLVVGGQVFGQPLLQVYGAMISMLMVILLMVERMKGPSLKFGPRQKFEAYAAVVERIRASRSFLKVIDLYPGVDTLSALASAPVVVPVKFLTLTANLTTERDAFFAAARRLMEERPSFEMRIADRQVFHDRWILTEPHGWHLTQSIKDIGNKIGHIIEMSIEETAECVEEFDHYWSESEALNV